MATASPPEPRPWWAWPRGSRRSLKYQCFRSIALASALAWLAVTAGIVWLAQRETDAWFDESLSELAHATLAFVDHELAEIDAAGGHKVDEDVADIRNGSVVYQVWHRDGRLGYRSQHAPASPLSPGRPGFGETRLGTQALRTYTAWNGAGTFQVQMAAFAQRHESYSHRVSIALCVGLLLAWLLFIGLIRHQLDRAFAPLNSAADALGRKSVADLSPVDTEGQLAELVPAIEAFNGLMARMGQALQHEQRFTSDAAHELKTPLAGLKVLVRNAQRARDDEQRREALAQMDVAIDRSTALVDQLLALARFDREPGKLALDEPVDLRALTLAATHDLQPVADERGIRPQLLEPGAPMLVSGNRMALSVLLRNLLENALRHVPPQGLVEIELLAPEGTGQVELRVHDNGPGIAPEMRPRVFGRFFRLDRNATPGAGLGLALVKRIAEIHGGSALLEDSPRLGGTLAIVRLPRARTG